MLHRIFIAINLPKELKETLKEYQKNFRELPAKWVRPENLHITLLFLGNVKTEILPKVFETTKSVSENFSKFKVELEKIDFVPPNTFPPRMIWVFIKKSETLLKLQKLLSKKLLFHQIPFQKEEREFTPHVTLARIKKFEFRNIEPEEILEIKTEISFSFEVNSIEVMESHLKRTGPEYTILKSFSFKESK